MALRVGSISQPVISHTITIVAQAKTIQEAMQALEAIHSAMHQRNRPFNEHELTAFDEAQENAVIKNNPEQFKGILRDIQFDQHILPFSRAGSSAS